jgi:hypothetical protein
MFQFQFFQNLLLGMKLKKYGIPPNTPPPPTSWTLQCFGSPATLLTCELLKFGKVIQFCILLRHRQVIAAKMW